MKNCTNILLTIFISLMVSMATYAQIDTLCFGSTLENYSITPNAGSNYSWSVSGGGVTLNNFKGTKINLDDRVI